jgi:hypothetical protein
LLALNPEPSLVAVHNAWMIEALILKREKRGRSIEPKRF